MGKNAVEKIVENFVVNVEKVRAKKINREKTTFRQLSVENQLDPELVVILEVISRITPVISESVRIISSILRIELSAVV